MNKKLKIQFWKAEKALAIQILEQEGLPKEKGDGFVKIIDSPALVFETGVWLRGYQHCADFKSDSVPFNTNSKRDAYLQKVVNAITEELFSGEGELKVGEMCEVSDCRYSWVKRRLLAILPEHYEVRFITENDSGSWSSWFYARPITKRIEPIVEKCGNVVTYTWEEK